MACGKGISSIEVSSSSHWLACETLADCPTDVGAAACSAEGYCVDAGGAPIEGGPSTGAVPNTVGDDAGLAEIGVTLEPLPEDAEGPAEPYQYAEALLELYCGECHGAAARQNGTVQGDISYITDLDRLAEEGWVVPLDSSGSELIAILRAGTMPPPGTEPHPGPELAELVSWVVDNAEVIGEPIANPACEPSALGFDAELSAIGLDLDSVPESSRPFLRYVSVPSGCFADRALAQLLNALSRGAQYATPYPVSDEALYRVDLRELGWDAPATRWADGAETVFGDAWEALVGASPYAVPFEGPDAVRAMSETNTTVPLLSLHGLLAAAMDAPTYYAVLDLRARAAERRFSTQADSGTMGVRRAGISNTLWPDFHALIERRPSTGGDSYFWSAAYGAPDGSGASPATRPFAFAAVETHVLMELPNGFPAFFILDAEGGLVGESTLVFPTSAFDEFDSRFSESAGFGGQSPLVCYLACHDDTNVLGVVDEVRWNVERDTASYGPEALAQLRALYPRQDELNRVFAADAASYRLAANRVEWPLMTVNTLTSLFLVSSAAELSRAHVAEILGLSDTEVVLQLSSAFPELAGEFVDRDTFRARFRAALCAVQGPVRNRPSTAFCSGGSR